MILLLVERAQALCVHDYDRHGLFLVVLSVEDLLPNPEAFGAGINGRPHRKSLQLFALQILFEEFVHEVRLSSSILAAYCYDTNFLFYTAQKLCGLFSNFEFLVFNIVLYEGNCD